MPDESTYISDPNPQSTVSAADDAAKLAAVQAEIATHERHLVLLDRLATAMHKNGLEESDRAASAEAARLQAEIDAM